MGSPPTSPRASRSTQELNRLDLTYVWHPFTQMKEWEQEERLVIERGEGNFLWDTEGARYLDGVSSLWANVHGHGRDEIKDAVRGQLDRLDHSTMLGLTHAPGIELARRLAAVAPSGLTRTFYSESGSTAVEIALKTAFQYWRNLGVSERSKHTFLCLREGYHGDTLGAVSVGGIQLFHDVYRPLLFRTYLAPSPHCYRCALDLKPESCDMACAGEVERILKSHHGDIAAMILEPRVQGAGGILTAPEGYLTRVRNLCREFDVLFIADEVATGFGRTGTLFACLHEDTAPDLMALGKGITGGTLPLAATLATERIFQGFYGDYAELKTFYHGHTYTGNPLACAAALASMDLFERDRVLEGLPAKIEAFRQGLHHLSHHPHVGDVRQAGLMMGIELVADKRSKTPFPLEQRLGHRISLECRRHGVIIRPLGDVLVLMPPLSIRPEEIQLLLFAVTASIEKHTGKRCE